MQYFATLNYFNPSSNGNSSSNGGCGCATADDQNVPPQQSTTATTENEEEYWLTDEIIDVPLISTSNSQIQSPHITNMKNYDSKKRTTFYNNNADNLSNDSSDPPSVTNAQLNENDVTSSSSSTFLNKINKNEVRMQYVTKLLSFFKNSINTFK